MLQIPPLLTVALHGIAFIATQTAAGAVLDGKDAAPLYRSTCSMLTTTELGSDVCANAASSYFHSPLLGPADTSPVALGRGALRRFRWVCKLDNQAAVSNGTRLAPHAPANWAPWTHMPVCGRKTNYCVFTLATLPAGALGTGFRTSISSAEHVVERGAPDAPRGISILTTPEMAAYELHPHNFIMHPTAQHMFDEFVALAPAYAAATATKGAGVVATRAIRAGEPILVDRPVILAHMKKTANEDDIDYHKHIDDYGLGPETSDVRANLWKAAIDQLPPETAEHISETLPVRPRLRKVALMAGLSQEEQLFTSNAFPITLGDGFHYQALFPRLTPFTHDCDANLCTTATKNATARERSDALRREVHRLAHGVAQNSESGELSKAVAKALEVHAALRAEGAFRNGTGFASQLPNFARTPANRPMADPMGPEGFAATLGGLLASNGDIEMALPFLRAAVEEIAWRSASSPTPSQRQKAEQLQIVIAELEEWLTWHTAMAGSSVVKPVLSWFKRMTGWLA